VLSAIILLALSAVFIASAAGFEVAEESVVVVFCSVELLQAVIAAATTKIANIFFIVFFWF